ncbi:MAG: ATP cone domain-containing protein [Planctomycetota bacterium]
MKRGKPLIITKRDGTLECFSVNKLRVCLAKVLQAWACEPEAADPLTQAIALHLREGRPELMPTTEYLYRCVSSVLLQSGFPEASAGLREHRRLRQARRRRVRVFDTLQTPRSSLKWRKGAIVATLQNVYDLRQPVARFLAARIEEQVFNLGYRLVSKTFLSELVRNEVLAWGLLITPVNVASSAVPLDEHVGGGQARQEE